MSDILDKIIAVKREEIAEAIKRKPLAVVREDAESRVLTRDFVGALRAKISAGKPAVIAEVKKASPSKGVLRADFIPADIAQSYAEHGAACLSVLTDRQFFQGSVDYLKQARASCALPVLRKDFMVDAYQVYEARVMGADCILLIAACLTPAEVKNFAAYTKSIGLESILEIHNEEELGHICDEVDMVGVNNRNLKTFEVSIETSLNLIDKIPVGKPAIAESGISSVETIQQLRAAGFKGFLIGETFMKEETPGQAFEEFVNKLKD